MPAGCFSVFDAYIHVLFAIFILCLLSYHHDARTSARESAHADTHHE